MLECAIHPITYRTPLKNCFFILYTVSQSWLMYFILC